MNTATERDSTNPCLASHACEKPRLIVIDRIPSQDDSLPALVGTATRNTIANRHRAAFKLIQGGRPSTPGTQQDLLLLMLDTLALLRKRNARRQGPGRKPQ